MKCLLLTLALLIVPAFGVAQSTQTDKAAQEQAKREAKERRKAEERELKAITKQIEAEEKERFKRPAEIAINAPSDKVGAVIVQHLNSIGYQIAEEGKYRLVFSQEVEGTRGALAQGLMGGVSRPRRTVAFTVSQIGDVSTVTADLSVTTEMRYGRVQRTDMNKNKGWRRELEIVLNTIKYKAEAK